MLKGRSVPFYRWGTVIQADVFLSSFLNTQVFAYLFRTSVTLGLQGFSGLCTSYNTLFPTVSLSSLILYHPQENISWQIFEHTRDTLWSWAEMCGLCHRLRLPNRMDDFMARWEGLFWGCWYRRYSCDALWNSYHVAYHFSSADFPSVCKAGFCFVIPQHFLQDGVKRVRP